MKKPLRLLITAGPTREPIDPVRFVSNYSSGVLGHALVDVAKRRGHRVVFVTGPTGMPAPRGVNTIAVETALQMQEALEREFPKADALIMAAAVADFRPVRAAAQKIKRSGVAGAIRLWRLDLVENPDIVAGLATRRTHQVVIGFALETTNALRNARAKLKAKQLDAIVLTHMNGARAPFGATTVDGALLDRMGRTTPFRRVAKPVLAARIVALVERLAAEPHKKT